jgi:DNA-binding transcriptional ArsR family regulator
VELIIFSFFGLVNMDETLYERAESEAVICKAIGNSRRLLILWQLSKKELSVNEIAASVGSTLQNVSQHLSVLKKAGIVVARREGQAIYYQLADREWLKKCPALLPAIENNKDLSSARSILIKEKKS